MKRIENKMDSLEIIKRIFKDTENLLENVWKGKENPQIDKIMDYLLQTARYLKNEDEAKTFMKFWNRIEERIKCGNKARFFEENSSIKILLENAKTFNYVGDIGLFKFYKETFPWLYKEAEEIYLEFQTFQEEKIKDYAKETEEKALWI